MFNLSIQSEWKGRLAICGMFLLVSLSVVRAAPRSADDYFDAGANFYIDKDIEMAKDAVEQGLIVYEQDRKLTVLKKILEQEQEQEDQDQEQDQQEQDQQEQDQQDQQQDQDQEQQDEQEQSDQEQSDSEDQPERDSPPEQASEEEISKQEAELLLDAMEQDEKAAREKMRLMLGQPQPVDKDW